ncbi:2-oxoacid:ferredoxin oxidoreductase subunit gamma [Candidatus Bathyarchaeota archaeon]|jgi:2-oxoglutarate ferredoxin oxidoreductase subunit gamma|nr:MAG: 2-oxoacid:ferredoxin oxidoreductase subunit gamma [Candidatus Bathyarchaeota archaeon]
MLKGILISGTGGQGILAAGEFLSEALFKAGYEVVNSRSYGSEARGGSCRSQVLVSDEEIYDLSLGEADILVVLSAPAFSRYQGRAKAGGLVLVDSEVIEKHEGEIRDDVELVQVRAGETALGLGNPIVANMVLLGALAKRSGLITLDDLKEAVKTGMRASMQEINFRALDAGYAAA